MEQLKRILKNSFCLPPLPTILIALPSFALVIYVLVSGAEDSLLSYAAYVLSAYSMIIVVTGMKGIVQSVRRCVEKLPLIEKVTSHPLGERYFGDVAFRTKVSLYRGILINLAYVAIKLGSGIYYRSSWFLSLAAYYALLVVMRFLLLRHFNENEVGRDMEKEFRRYRGCGIILLFMNQALAVIVILMVHQNRGYEYPGLLIYAMAAYAFYAVIFAVINMVKYRRHGSPVLSAAKVISLTAALVSILSLETAMLAQFGGDDSTLRQTMTAATGGGVCTVVFAMAIYMIIRSSKQLKKIKNNKIST